MSGCEVMATVRPSILPYAYLQKYGHDDSTLSSEEQWDLLRNEPGDCPVKEAHDAT